MSERRDWLTQTAALSVSLGSGLALGGEALAQAAAPKPAGPKPWQNWSGIQQCQARQWLMPKDEAQLAAAIGSAPGPLRCVGAGHSFSALVPTDGTLISLDRLTGIIAIDKATSTVRVRAGTRLAQLARELHGQGLALHNQPDIDVQTLAGALATGTHGTGQTLPALHDEVQALRLVTPAGEIKDCSRRLNPELFDAARVSLGALGVITEYTLRVRPRYMLARRVWLERTEGLLEKAPELARQHRHFEMYVLPFTGYSAGITHSEVAEGPAQHPSSADENVLRDLQRLRDWLGRWPDLRRWTAAKLIDPAQTEFAQDWSWRLLSTVRPTRFNESEYHLPREAGIACLKDILATLEKRNDIFFPIEFRFIRGDGAWLSPFHGRDSCSIATHALQGEAYQYLIAELGPVFKRHGGRPHWGKLHDLQLKDLRSMYPRFADFQRVRESVDPQGRMLNAHLRQLFVGAANA